MGGIGGPELLLVFLVVLLVFGPRKIPEVARGIGKGLREFRRLSVDLQREINLAETDEEKARRASRPDRSPPERPAETAPPRESPSGTEPLRPPES